MTTNDLPIAFFNGPVMTTDGLFRLSEISLEEIKELLNTHEYISAIGHESTAELLSDILNIPLLMNRIQFTQEIGQKVIIFKLNIRTPEGVILSREEIENYGYQLKLLERIE